MKRSYPSTNRLGVARSDCQTCERLSRQCDRQRPQCTICLKEGQRCGGYVVEINWGKAQLFVPGEVSRSDQTRESQAIRFVTVNGKRRKKQRRLGNEAQKLVNVFSASDELSDEEIPMSIDQAFSDQQDCASDLEHSAATNVCPSWNEALWLAPAPSVSEQLPAEYDDTLERDLMVTQLYENGAQDYSHDNLGHQDEYNSPHYTAYSSSDDESSISNLPLAPVVQYSSFADQVAAVLDMYNQEFCVLPLSEDVRCNPFRIDREASENAAFLLHAVLAVASQHLAKKNKSAQMLDQMHAHQGMAVKLFSEAVADTPPSVALDTLLLLITLDATQTASSTFGVHLGGAFTIIESVGIDLVCQHSSRTRAQIAMLIWTDITIALIARKPTRFPDRYLKTLLRYSGEDGWSWMSLNGCSVDLVKIMARLTRLATIFEKVLDMEWASFDHTPVRRIIDELCQWKNPEDLELASMAMPESPPSSGANAVGSDRPEHSWTDYDKSDDPDVHINNMHCLEAWRHALLLYAHRVFFRRELKPGADDGVGGRNEHEISTKHRRLRTIRILSRKVMDHIQCIPAAAIVQKQALLPIFLAGAEMVPLPGDSPAEYTGLDVKRNFVRVYCKHWTELARYNMFASVSTLLERVWAEADSAVASATHNECPDDSWWGCYVGPRGFTSAATSTTFHSDDSGDDGLFETELLLG
jgi:hypothetical protein